MDAKKVVSHIKDYLTFQQDVYSIEELLRHHMVSFYNDNPESTVRPKDITITNVKDADKGRMKTPLLKLPTFSGDYKKFSMFMDMFKCYD